MKAAFISPVLALSLVVTAGLTVNKANALNEDPIVIDFDYQCTYTSHDSVFEVLIFDDPQTCPVGDDGHTLAKDGVEDCTVHIQERVIRNNG